jgi:hypothetical protein
LTQDRLVNALKKNLSPHQVGKYGKLMKHSSRRHHRANKGKSGCEAGRVQALGALFKSRFRKMLAAEKQKVTHFLSNEEGEK